jgi:hypothetical protein
MLAAPFALPPGDKLNMDDRPTPPWIAIPGIFKRRSATPGDSKQVQDWLRFLFALSPVEFCQYVSRKGDILLLVNKVECPLFMFEWKTAG